MRLPTADEPQQLKAARRLLSAPEGEHATFFVNHMVLVELVWVLQCVYSFEQDEALLTIKSLRDSDAFAFADCKRLGAVFALCASGLSRDFADTRIALRNVAALCELTASFDKATRGFPGMRLL